MRQKGRGGNLARHSSSSSDNDDDDDDTDADADADAFDDAAAAASVFSNSAICLLHIVVIVFVAESFCTIRSEMKRKTQ